MLKILQSKKWASAVMLLVILSAAAVALLGFHFFINMDSAIQTSVPLDGKYSLDDGEWQPIEQGSDINVVFHKAVFKGKLLEDTKYLRSVTFSTKNVWYTLTLPDGSVLCSHKFDDPRELYERYSDTVVYYADGIKKLTYEEYRKVLWDIYGFGSVMENTPGYSVQELDLGYSEGIPGLDGELTLEVIYPYDVPRMEFSDCFSTTISESNGKYMQFFYSMPVTIIFLLVCFFGLFIFPMAAFILGKIEYRFLAFGALCIFWGLFMIVNSLSGFMNLWLTDSTVCMLIERLTNYFFYISVLFYLKSNLTIPVTRAIGNILGTVFFIIVAAVTALHFTQVIDLHASSVYVASYTAFCAIVMTVLFCIETLTHKIHVGMLLSWIPLTVCVLIDVIDSFLHFAPIDFHLIGLSVTMIYQLVISVVRLKRQYKEALRFQEMKKELYEAKVSVMVSQIQPHFMYNALSSIAMLCKLDPDTAYQATITFSQYLRSNMDSLKQTKPVPFTQELEHLKKYLYIEKLRFGKKLNIEYDIQATDFCLPQLSIQPLAENAVKHGISKKRGGGTLTIATRETPEAYEVIVSDDGTGFDVNEVKNDGRSHIGMENIRRRLKEMCGADVIITSAIGEGTVARVVLPKELNKELSNTLTEPGQGALPSQT